VAVALAVPITAVFEIGAGRRPVVFLKSAERPRVPFSRGLFEALGGERFTGRVEPFHLTLETGGSSGPGFVVHTGGEFVMCLRGALEYTVENSVYTLETGDTLLFAAHLRHRWRNPGHHVTNAIIVIANFDENDHLVRRHISDEDGRSASGLR
jgi:quercetin dioxygenase-like cupin family protein